MGTAIPEQAPDVMLDEWLKVLDQSLEEICGWAQEQGWLIRSDAKEIEERQLGRYATQVLTIKTPQGHMVVEPTARRVAGGAGRVDLYAWPSMHRVWLVRRGDQWVVRTESGIDWPRPWGRECFLDLVKQLTTSP